MDDSDRDAYEAAQNILKAINFGDLLQIAQNEDGINNDNKKSSSSLSSGGDGGEVSMDQLTSLLIQAQHAISSQQQSMEGQLQQQAMAGVGRNSTLASVTPLPTLSATAGVAVASTSTSSSSHVAGSSSSMGMNVRAELQAQLALLAVQLAELGQESENGAGAGVVNGVVGQLLQSQNGMVAASRSEDVGRREREVDGGLTTVFNSEGPPLPRPPPMNGLLPLSLNHDPNSNSNSAVASKTIPSSESQMSSETTRSQRLQGRQEDGDGDGNDDIPIDPVLRDACVVPVVGGPTSAVTPPVTTTTTTSTLESVQSLPPVSDKITGSEPTVSGTTAAVSASVLQVDQGQEQELGNAIPSMMTGEGKGHSDDSDDDMEEII